MKDSKGHSVSLGSLAKALLKNKVGTPSVQWGGWADQPALFQVEKLDWRKWMVGGPASFSVLPGKPTQVTASEKERDGLVLLFQFNELPSGWRASVTQVVSNKTRTRAKGFTGMQKAKRRNTSQLVKIMDGRKENKLKKQ